MEEEIVDQVVEEVGQGDQAAAPKQNQEQGSGCGRGITAQPQDVVLAATSLALALTKGRSQYEMETLINLFSLTTNILQSILAQTLINKKAQDFFEIPL